MLKLYYSLVHSNLNYGLPAWGKLPILYKKNYKNYRIKLSGLLQEENGTRGISPLYKGIVLQLPELFKLEIAKIVHNHSKNRLHLAFNNYIHLSKSSHSRLTRFSHRDQLIIPLFKTQKVY